MGKADSLGAAAVTGLKLGFLKAVPAGAREYMPPTARAVGGDDLKGEERATSIFGGEDLDGEDSRRDELRPTIGRLVI